MSKVQNNMGIGKLGDSHTVFSRKFRWILEGTNLPSHYVSNVSFDFVAKTIHFSYYDVVTSGQEGMQALVWADNIIEKKHFNETLTFTTLDGCGNHLYKLTFKDLSVISHTADFNYDSSDCAKTNLTIKYEIVHKELINCPDQFKRYNWKLSVCGKEFPFFWRIDSRPSLNIQETEVNYLNEKTFLPGKVKWNPMRITTSIDVGKLISSQLLEGKNFDCELKLYKDESLSETWGLKGCWAAKSKFSETELDIELHAKSMSYSAEYTKDKSKRKRKQ
jgi:hypothetical protein